MHAATRPRHYAASFAYTRDKSEILNLLDNQSERELLLRFHCKRRSASSSEFTSHIRRYSRRLSLRRKRHINYRYYLIFHNFSVYVRYPYQLLLTTVFVFLCISLCIKGQGIINDKLHRVFKKVREKIYYSPTKNTAISI